MQKKQVMILNKMYSTEDIERFDIVVIKYDGRYIINRLNIPLTYNGQMSINATKMYSNIN